MSLINFSKNFLFVHIPKTGGSSISRMLNSFTTIRDLEIGGTPFGEGIAPYYEKKFGIYKHSSATELEKIIGIELYQQMWSFTIVRNPYFRTLSLFRFLKQWGGPYRSEIKKIKYFKDFVDSALIHKISLCQPQSSWIVDQDDILKIDSWFKLESLGQELPTLARNIGIPIDELKLSKTNETKKNSEDLKYLANPSIQDKIKIIYHKDFKLFNYSEQLDFDEIEKTFHDQTKLLFKFKYLINKPKGWL